MTMLVGGAATEQPARPSAARARILAAADRLFYVEGIRATAVDRIISEAQVTRVTFYRHFASKDHLIAAYLRARLLRDQDHLAGLRRDHPDDPHAVLAGVVENLTVDTSAPDFRGCAYANITAEYCDQDHPARAIAGEHRAWLLSELEALLVDIGVPRPGLVAEQLVMLRAGAMAVASVASTEHLAAAFSDAWTALIERPSLPGNTS